MNETRISEQEAGYLELPGAVKDADCNVVEVEGGVSSDRGCCNSFGIQPQSDSFKCGDCKYLTDAEDRDGEEKPLGRREAGKMSFEQVLDSDRPVDVTPKGRG